ncbi:unnamed protein product [Enterobius vermicularis]|uniref:INCENP_ARK-bind domain-containing protein n=1 Tax=Enterobius vermicularis TaxID=51028 RepID=A0A0N4VF61_ENTVE|nr:unnamed protein product [Enterobius vermicularis]
MKAVGKAAALTGEQNENRAALNYMVSVTADTKLYEIEKQSNFMFDLYLQEGFRGLECMMKLIENRKQTFRNLIKEKTGRNVRKTPRRRNKFTELEHKICAIAVAFDNDEDTDGEQRSVERGTADRRLRAVPKQARTPDLFATPVSSKCHAVRKTPSSARMQKMDGAIITKMEATTPQEARQARSATRLAKKKTELPIAASPQKPLKQRAKKSELIRKLEAKQKAVISNKEELIKIKAERARRDREERAQRVYQNNKRKEMEREAAIRAVRERELAVEEIRRYQESPVKGLKAVSRTNSKSPSRLRMVHATTTKVPFSSVAVQKLVKGNSQSHDEKVTLVALTKPIKRKPNAMTPVIPVKRNTVLVEKPKGLQERIAHDRDLSSNKSRDSQSSQKTETDGYAGAGCIDGIRKEPGVSTTQLPSSTTAVNAVKAPKQLSNLKAEVNAPNEVTSADTKRLLVTEQPDNHQGNSRDLEREREEVREKLGLLDSSQLNNKNLMNVTACSSYEITPPKKPSPSTEDNYNIDSLSSGDETDEEDNPKKKVPNWAQPINLRRALREQAEKSPHVIDLFFGQIETPDLNKIFSMQRTRYAKRTSSAQWNSPLANPREGISVYYAIQRQK